MAWQNSRLSGLENIRTRSPAQYRQGPDRFRRRIAQQRHVFRGQRMSGPSRRSGKRLGVECRQQKALVFPEAGPGQRLLGQREPR
jgi:hypothetical protein